MYTYQIEVEYLGTDFVGWQMQKNAPTIQGELHKTYSYTYEEYPEMSYSYPTEQYDWKGSLDIITKENSYRIDLEGMIQGQDSLLEYQLDCSLTSGKKLECEVDSFHFDGIDSSYFEGNDDIYIHTDPLTFFKQ